jgi:hypothetical protein
MSGEGRGQERDLRVPADGCRWWACAGRGACRSARTARRGSRRRRRSRRRRAGAALRRRQSAGRTAGSLRGRRPASAQPARAAPRTPRARLRAARLARPEAGPVPGVRMLDSGAGLGGPAALAASLPGQRQPCRAEWMSSGPAGSQGCSDARRPGVPHTSRPGFRRSSRFPGRRTGAPTDRSAPPAAAGRGEQGAVRLRGKREIGGTDARLRAERHRAAGRERAGHWRHLAAQVSADASARAVDHPLGAFRAVCAARGPRDVR